MMSSFSERVKSRYARPMRWTELSREACPVARGLSVVGDRWTLLILRELFLGVRRFERMQERLGITRHILADRLRKLEAAGTVRRARYQERPPRHEYRLTDSGRELYPVLAALMAWADRHVPPETSPPYTIVSRTTGAPIDPVLVDRGSGEEITLRGVSAVENGGDG
jgi:DNA-binding HxlR family transcriptional regulator